MRLIAISVLSILFATSANAWDHRVQRDTGQPDLHIAETIGEAGLYLKLVCFQNRTHIELEYPAALYSDGDGVELFQVDQRPEVLIAGFYEDVAADTAIFVGIDRRDKPAVATPDLLGQISAGRVLYLGDPDRSEAVERWSLDGSSKALKKLQQDCK